MKALVFAEPKTAAGRAMFSPRGYGGAKPRHPEGGRQIRPDVAANTDLTTWSVVYAVDVF